MITAGVFDPIKENRMDWLWEFNPQTNKAYVKENIVDLIENEFSKYLEKEGWPAPAKDWVLAMGIQGGAGSYQWNENSDVDVMVVLDWLLLFKKMANWTIDQFEKVDLKDQYYVTQSGKRLMGSIVFKKMGQCISGMGIWRGKGIKHKSVLTKIAPTHPVDYHLVRGLSHKDLRFQDQPPLVDMGSLSSYLVDLPIHRRRQEDVRDIKDTQWLNEIEKPPTGFNLKKDGPELYQKGLSLLRFITMPLDYLYFPDNPKDIAKALAVLKDRSSDLFKYRRDGYKRWLTNKEEFKINIKGKDYYNPDWFPANIGVKLLESTGPINGKELIRDLLKDPMLKDVTYSNFNQVKEYLRKLIGDNFMAVKKLLKSDAVGQSYRFKEALSNQIYRIASEIEAKKDKIILTPDDLKSIHDQAAWNLRDKTQKYPGGPHKDQFIKNDHKLRRREDRKRDWTEE